MFKEGDVIQMIEMYDDPDPIPSGTKGIVTESNVINFSDHDQFEQVSVDWENGRTLMLTVPPDMVKKIGAARFKVIEYFNHYAVRHIPTGEEKPMGDGVDTLMDEECKPIPCGTEAFRIAWQEALNETEYETLEAYFPEIYDKVIAEEGL